MEQEKLDKLCTLLDRSEQDVIKLLVVKDNLSKHSVQEKFKKSLEIYTMIAGEFGNYCYLNGSDKQRNIIMKLSRGYNTLLNQILKLLLAYFERKSDKLTSQPQKLPDTYDPIQESSNSVILKTPVGTMAAIQSNILDQGYPANRGSLPSAIYASADVNFKERANNMRSFTMVPRIEETRHLESLSHLDDEETKDQADETVKAIEEILKRKDVLKQVSATESVFHLKQILRNLANTKRRGGQIGNEELNFEDEEDADFDAIQDDLLRTYDGAQRKTAKRVIRYVNKTQKSEKTQKLEAVVKNSVGTEPDYALLEAEKMALLKMKDDEYQKLVYTREAENKTLRERVEDLQTRLSAAVAEALELKVRNAGDDVSRNEVEKTIRQLKLEIGSLKDKVDRKKLKIKSLKEDIEMFNYQTKGAGNQFDNLVTRNGALLEENGELKEKCSGLETENVDLKERIKELEERIKELEEKLNQTIEDYEEKLARSPKTQRLQQLDFSPRLKELGGNSIPNNPSLFKFEATPQQKEPLIKSSRKGTETKFFPSQAHSEVKKEESSPKNMAKSIASPQNMRKETTTSKKSIDATQSRRSDATPTAKNQATGFESAREGQQTARNSMKTRENAEFVIGKESIADNKHDNDALQEEAPLNTLDAIENGIELDENEIEHRNPSPTHQIKSYSDLQVIGGDSTRLPADENLNSHRTANNTDMKLDRSVTFDWLKEKAVNPFVKIDRFLREADLNADHLHKYLDSKSLHNSHADHTPKSNLSYNFSNRKEFIKPELQMTPTPGEERKFLPKHPTFSSATKDVIHTREYNLLGQKNAITGGVLPKAPSLQTFSATNQSFTNSTTNLLNETSAEYTRKEPVNPKFRAHKMIGRIVDRNNTTTNSNASVSTSRGPFKMNKEEHSSFLRQQRQINSPVHYLMGDSSENVSGSINDTLSQTLRTKMQQTLSSKSLVQQITSDNEQPGSNNTLESYLDAEYSLRETHTDKNRKTQQWEQQRELAKIKEEKELEEVYRGLQQKVVFVPRLKKIFSKFVQKNNPGITDQDIENGNFEVEFNAFKEYMANFKETHKRCGDDCPHLRRFYEKVGYLNTRYRKRETFNISVTEIDKLPRIVRKIYV